MSFVDCYKEAKTIKEKFLCVVAKLLRAHLVTPLGRIVLLSVDYEKAKESFILSCDH